MSVVLKTFGARQPKTLLGLAERIRQDIEVCERSLNSCLPRFYTSLRRVEVMTRGILSSVLGNGDTPEEAMRDYARQLAGYRVAVNAYTPEREELDIPNDFHHEEES